ncbi:hypothetical protein Glove_213g131 [Diversispora epigaea]|uniref:Protein kinase domain-containing protein n=1 Tax=Diversispora epigaea TaxID=1348612 RepID=A0A397IHV2_9GLOM|nr:hypothetical protein Glove_213g131 [Diversispora epigaea]
MTKIFFTRKLDGSDKNIKCFQCKRRSRINSSHICYYCHGIKSLNVANSGNINIDNFIKGTQTSKNSIDDSILEWIPFKEFKDVKKIGQGGFSQIFTAVWKINSGINERGTVRRVRRKIVLKVLNNSQNIDTEFLNELKHTFQFQTKLPYKYTENIIECYGVTQDPQSKNYAFVLEYIPNGDLHHFMNKNFEIFSWTCKISYLNNIVKGIKKIHYKGIIHRDLHSGNILVYDKYPIISDLGFSQPANIDSNLSKESQIYGIIPYMAPELFRNQPYSYASDIYSLGMIMWQLTSGHRPFHDQEHGPKLILDILDGKRPEITEDTLESWANLMKRCWHPDPSQRPTILEIFELSSKFSYGEYSEDDIKKYYPDGNNIWLEFNEAEKKRLEMVESKKPFVKNPGYEHPNSRYYSTSLNSMLESINSTVSDLFFNNLLSNDHFDIVNLNSSNQKQNFENSDYNSRAKNSKKHFLGELLQENIEDQDDFKRRKFVEYFNECLS